MTAVSLSFVVLAAVGLSSWAMTGWLRQYALQRQMVDVPNPRSSHRVTTPRGGGGAIVVASTVALAWWSWVSGSAGLAGVLAGGLVVAGIGFLDDHRHVPPTIRLAGHSLAALLAVASLEVMSLGGIAAAGLAVVFVAWLINLTNFMDGIDGIAGVHTLSVCAAGAALFHVTAPGAGLWIEPAILGAAAIGFLIWNWPPARVFMGDVGSGYVGFMVAAFTLRATLLAPALGWSWLILSGVFVVDATVTLLRRAARRERLFQAHRSHAYQHLAAAWGSHRSVTLLVAAINVCWLAPLAVLVAANYISGPTGLCLAYLPLTIGAVWLGAGSVSRP